jgi:predicted DNA-binding transcriptional regulator YafY
MTLRCLTGDDILRGMDVKGWDMPKQLFEEKVRTNRLLLIDDLIRSGVYPNASTLSKKAEVTPRTILRDIDYLRLFYNAPIAYDAFHRGYYYTEKNFFVKSVLLTERELFSIAIFDRILDQYRYIPLEGHLREIFRKIAQSLPQKITVDSQFLTNYVSFIPDHEGIIDMKVFEAVFSALRTNTPVNEYRSLQKTFYTKLTADPYHAICHRGNRYVIGYCHDREEPRMFALSRIKNAKVSGKPFKIPADFDPSEYFDKEMGVWASSRTPYTVEFVVDREIGTYALDRQWHETQTVKENKDGSVRVTFPTTQIPEVLRWILGQGHTVKILNPPELTGMVKDGAEMVRGIYA